MGNFIDVPRDVQNVQNIEKSYSANNNNNNNNNNNIKQHVHFKLYNEYELDLIGRTLFMNLTKGLERVINEENDSNFDSYLSKNILPIFLTDKTRENLQLTITRIFKIVIKQYIDVCNKISDDLNKITDTDILFILRGSSACKIFFENNKNIIFESYKEYFENTKADDFAFIVNPTVYKNKIINHKQNLVIVVRNVLNYLRDEIIKTLEISKVIKAKDDSLTIYINCDREYNNNTQTRYSSDCKDIQLVQYSNDISVKDNDKNYEHFVLSYNIIQNGIKRGKLNIINVSLIGEGNTFVTDLYKNITKYIYEYKIKDNNENTVLSYSVHGFIWDIINILFKSNKELLPEYNLQNVKHLNRLFYFIKVLVKDEYKKFTTLVKNCDSKYTDDDNIIIASYISRLLCANNQFKPEIEKNIVNIESYKNKYIKYKNKYLELKYMS
jgi:hypothetical protein